MLPIYEGTAEETKPLELARSARREAMQTGRDVVLVDTAGRQHIDEQLMQELSRTERSAESNRDSLCRRRHDGPGRRQVSRRIP